MPLDPIPLWPFPPNWRQPYTVSYEFKTDIFTSRSGKEQRRAQRTTPRRTFHFTATTRDDDTRLFRRTLALLQGKTLLAPDLSRFATLATAAGAGSNALQIAGSIPSWCAGAEEIIVAARGQPYQLAQVQSVKGATVYLVDPLSAPVPGFASLHPIVRGRLRDSTSVSDYTDTVQEAEVTIAADPAAGLPEDLGSPDDVFNKREVFTFAPNRVKPIEGEFRKFIDTVDFGRGRVINYFPVAFSVRMKQLQMLTPTVDDRTRLVALFLRMKGQRGEFYMPSYEDDFTILDSTSTTVTVQGNWANDLYQGDDTRRAIMVEWNGIKFYRRVTASGLSGSNTVLTTDEPWPCPLDDLAVLRWLSVYRMGVDQLSLDCVTSTVSQTQLTVLSLEDLPVAPPDDIFPLTDAAAWLADAWGVAFSVSRILDPLDRIVNISFPEVSRRYVS
jgi:hypothetical protein